MSNISKNHQFIVEGEIESSYGFYKFFFSNLKFYSTVEYCFECCNNYFREKFGYSRYESYKKFKGIDGINAKKPMLILTKEVSVLSNVDILERHFLMTLFKSKGFDTWVSFKALVLHYYPEITEKRLLQFYNNEAIDAEVLKKVEWVRQIIG